MRGKLVERIRGASLGWLIHAACVSTLIGLVFMVLPYIVSSPLFLIAGMSLAHAFGVVGVILFAAAVLRDVLLGQPQAGVQERDPNQPGS